uniref:ORF2 n=1 Tax=Anelloviridae sp. TaxID=2055263 RepID=A0A890CBT6_9VIRU|nr:ORF2 [Anelloviridae sp.]
MEPVKYSSKQLEKQLTNAYIHIHDLACGCFDPIKHILQQLVEGKIDTTISPDTLQKIKCLLTEDGGGEEDNKLAVALTDDLGLNEGELEELFKEDTDPDAAG